MVTSAYSLTVNLLAIFGTYYLVSMGIHLVLAGWSYLGIRQHLAQKKTFEKRLESFLKNQSGEGFKKISIVIPAFNEAAVIVESVYSFASIFYPNLELIVVDDGSSDQTSQLMIERFKMVPWDGQRRSMLSDFRPAQMRQSSLDPRIKLILKKNGGKASAANLGIDFSSGEFIGIVDADTFCESDSLLRIALSFFENPETIAVSGTLRILNGARILRNQDVVGKLPNHPLALFQVLEYLRSFYLGRQGWNYIGATILLSGAYTVFRQAELRGVGGYSQNTVTEDFDIALKMIAKYGDPFSRQSGKLFRVLGDPICWTQAPETLKHLKQQRMRWQQGLLKGLWTHRKLLLNRKLWKWGWGSVPYLFVFEGLSPIFTFGGYSAFAFHLTVHNLSLAHHPILIPLVLGLIGSWIFSLVAVHLEQKYFNRNAHQFRMHFSDGFRFMTVAALDLFVYHNLKEFWKLEVLVRLPFSKVGWGIKPRQVIKKEVVEDSKSNKAA